MFQIPRHGALQSETVVLVHERKIPGCLAHSVKNVQLVTTKHMKSELVFVQKVVIQILRLQGNMFFIKHLFRFLPRDVQLDCVHYSSLESSHQSLHRSRPWQQAAIAEIVVQNRAEQSRAVI